jgi:hypothetical protein
MTKLKNWLLRLKKEKYVYVDIDKVLEKIKDFQE